MVVDSRWRTKGGPHTDKRNKRGKRDSLWENDIDSSRNGHNEGWDLDALPQTPMVLVDGTSLVWDCARRYCR